MIGIKDIEFQDDCVDALINYNSTNKKGVIVKAPTGSGKTIVLIKYIDTYFRTYGTNTVFVWFCPGAGELEEQSKAEFEKHIKDRTAKNLDDALRTGFDAGDTVFINWEQVNSKTSKAMTENEHKNLMDQIIKAHRNNLKFVIIVDEEHAFNTRNSQAVITEFNSNFMVRVSATAKKADNYEWVEIPESAVINEGLITKALYINEGVSAGTVENENALLLKLADDKRKAIREEYRKFGKTINPLVIIQFPDSSSELIEKVEELLNSMGYSYENKALSKWMSDSSDKINLDGLTEKSAEQAFLLMKQAVATGWNCTRAKILVKLREHMSEDFKIQTIGRIRRMPEAKHYENELLDNCYLYTFDEEYTAGVRKELFSAYDVKRIILKEKCKTFTIKKENKDLDAGGISEKDVYKKVNTFLRQKLKLETSTKKNKTIFETAEFDISARIKSDVKTGKVILTDDVATGGDTITLDRKVKTHNDGIELQHSTNVLKSELKTNYATTERVLRKLFYGSKNGGKLLRLTTAEYYAFIINNEDKLKHLFREAMAEMMADPEFKLLPKTSEFKIPEEELLLYGDAETVKEMLSNAYNDYTDNCFVKRSKPERLFERHCEKAGAVDWVYKNGDSGQQYFSIVYYDGLLNQCLFYPDYIVKLKDESIWLIEAKGGEDGSGHDENIDKYAEKKFNALKEFASHYHVNFGFVRNKVVDDIPQLFLNNTTYTEDMGDKWVAIEKFIK